MTKLVLSLMVAFGPIVTPTSAGEIHPKSTKQSELTRCRIKLIDNITLESQWAGLLTVYDSNARSSCER